jgi:LysM repeat protein
MRADSQLAGARDLLSHAYLNNRLSKEQRLRIAEELGPLSWEVLNSPALLEEGRTYVVEPGDMLSKIAKPLRITPEFIMKLNGLKNARAIRPGQTLKLVQGPFDALIEQSEFELTVLLRGKFVRRFTIGIGKDSTPTPNGLYKVGDKQVDPTKYPSPGDSDRRILPPRHPDNPLGSRWIALGGGYGIHGTIEPETIGQKSSRGCIRLLNADVEDLYDMLTESSRVLIR